MPTEPDANSEITNRPESDATSTDTTAVISPVIGYPVSLKKFLIVTLCTLPLAHAYVLFWAYKNFCTFGFKKRTKLAAAVFTFFLPISLHELLRMLENRALVKGTPVHFHKTIVSATYIILKVVAGMCGRISTLTFPLSEFCDILSILLLIWVASRILLVNPEHQVTTQSNSQFTKGNIIGCVLGLIAWALIGFNATQPQPTIYQQPLFQITN
jgi:hypothetical protein